MQCPRCSIDLVTKRIGRIDIDECTECGGKWLDHGELERLTSAATAPDAVLVAEKAQESGSGLLVCPRCQRPDLVPIDHGASEKSGSVTIDVCRSCHGIWLDRGELERLREHVGSKRAGSIRWVNLYAPEKPIDLPMDLMF